jgi:hypothetical protein
MPAAARRLDQIWQPERERPKLWTTCGHAGEDIDCPTGGCAGFSVTVPAKFMANDQTVTMGILSTLASCFPKDANWNVTPLQRRAILRAPLVSTRRSIRRVIFAHRPRQQAATGNCLSFDPFPFDQNGLAPPEVDVGGALDCDALMISQIIVIGDEGPDLGFEVARQVVVLNNLRSGCHS